MSDNLQKIITELQGMRADLNGCLTGLSETTLLDVEGYILNASLAECVSVIGLLVDRVSNELGTARELEDARDALQDEIKQEPELCGSCNGSGEGQHEGTTCYRCKGRGVEIMEVVAA